MNHLSSITKKRILHVGISKIKHQLEFLERDKKKSDSNDFSEGMAYGFMQSIALLMLDLEVINISKFNLLMKIINKKYDEILYGVAAL